MILTKIALVSAALIVSVIVGLAVAYAVHKARKKSPSCGCSCEYCSGCHGD